MRVKLLSRMRLLSRRRRSRVFVWALGAVEERNNDLTFDVDDWGEGSFACFRLVDCSLRSVALHIHRWRQSNPIAIAMQMQQTKDRSMEFRIKVCSISIKPLLLIMLI